MTKEGKILEEQFLEDDQIIELSNEELDNVVGGGGNQINSELKSDIVKNKKRLSSNVISMYKADKTNYSDVLLSATSNRY